MTGFNNNLPIQMPFDQDLDYQNRQILEDRKKASLRMKNHENSMSPTTPPYLGPIGSNYNLHAQSNQQQHSQPLHYRTNFGKDYGYRPPSPASPMSTPTLLTQWSTQQIVERKRQQMLQRQHHWQHISAVPGQRHGEQGHHEHVKSDLSVPRLHLGTNHGTTHEVRKTDETPFDERDESPHLQQFSQSPIYTPENASPMRARLKFEDGLIVNHNMPRTNSGYIATQPGNPRSLVTNSSSSRESSNTSNHWSNIRIASPTLATPDGAKISRSVSSPRENRQVVPRPNNMTPPRAVIDRSYLDESSHISPIARIAASQNRSTLHNNLPPKNQTHYSVPVKLSPLREKEVNKSIAIRDSSPARPSVGDVALSPNEESTDTDNDEFDFFFDDERYGSRRLQEIAQNKCQIPKMRVSQPRTFPLGDLKTLASRNQFPIIGVPNMMTFADETSVLTGDFGEELPSEQVPCPPIQLIPKDDGSRDIAVISQGAVISRNQNGNSHGIIQPLSNRVKGHVIPSLSPMPQNSCSGQNPTSASLLEESHPLDELDVEQKSDSTTHMIDVGVARYLQGASKDKQNLPQSAPQTSSFQRSQLQAQSALPSNQVNGGKDEKPTRRSSVIVHNSTSQRSDEDSLFDFVDSTTTASTENETSTSTKPENSAAVPRKGLPVQGTQNRSDGQVSQTCDIKSQAIPRHSPFGNRFISLLQEDTDEDTVDTRLDRDCERVSDGATTEQKRVQAVWKKKVAMMNQTEECSKAVPTQSSSKSAKIGPFPASKHEQTPTMMLKPAVKNGSGSMSKQEKSSLVSSKPAAVDGGKGLLDVDSKRERRLDYLHHRKVQQIEHHKNGSTHSDIVQNNRTDGYDNVEATDGYQSLESMYTKSVESEAEDILKDIFMIGNGEATNPGRRNVKYKLPPEEKHVQLAAMDENASEETATTSADSITPDDEQHEMNEKTQKRSALASKDNDYRIHAPKSIRPILKVPTESNLKQRVSTVESKKDDDRLIGDVWSFVGNRISAVTFALGLVDSGESSLASPMTPSTRASISSPQSPSSDMTSRSSMARIISPFSSPESGKTDQTAANDNSYDDGSRSFSGWSLLDLASDVFLGSTPLSPCNELSSRATSVPEPDVVALKTDHSMLEDDARLLDLATQAAVSLHQIRGFEFDLAHTIDISRDIKFSVVDLKLPLGLIFQENDNGCWVKQVLRDGSAAQTNAVEAGDQLIAVDGISAVDMTVDEIAYLVRKQAHETVELTFLRYVGVFRPMVGSVVEEEGYEVMAKKESPNRPTSHKNPIEQPPLDDVSPRPDIKPARSCLHMMSKRSQTLCVGANVPKVHAKNYNGKKSKSLLPSFGKTTTLKKKHKANLANDYSWPENSIIQESSVQKKRGFRIFGRNRVT